jgi:hypothetical protein
VFYLRRQPGGHYQLHRTPVNLVKKQIRLIGTPVSRTSSMPVALPARLTASIFQASHTTGRMTNRYICSWFDSFVWHHRTFEDSLSAVERFV